MSRFRVISACLFFAAAAIASAQETTASRELGLPFVQSFHPHDYGDEHNQTWYAAQDRHGVLYVGNRDVVLTYDGFAWRSIHTGGVFVRGVAIDADDRVWIGAVNELGYLEDDGRGGRTFVSLREKLPPTERDFGSLFQVFAFSHGVYFVGDDRILRWSDGRFTVAHTGRALANAVGDELIVHVPGQALMAWRGDVHRVVSDAPELKAKTNWVTVVAPQPDGAWILGTLRGGLWRLADGKLARFPTAADATIRSGTIARGLALSDGTLALAIRPGGLLLLNPDGSVRHFLHSGDGGLLNSSPHALFQDRANGLWVMLDYGLARISWPDHTTVFNAANGMARGTVHAIGRHAGALYVGTFDGLFELKPLDATAAPLHAAHFVPVPDCAENVLALASAGDELLIAGTGGLRVRTADGKIARPFRGDLGMSLLVPRGDAHVAFVGTPDALLVFRRDADGWHNTATVAGLDRDEIRNLAEAPDGALWVSSANHGLYRIFGLPGTASAAPGAPPRVEHYASGHGLGPAPVTNLPVVAATSADPLFLVSNRLYRFDAAAREFREIHLGAPDLRIHGVGTGLDGHAWLRLERESVQGRDSRIARWSTPDKLEILPAQLAEEAGQSLVFLEEPAVPDRDGKADDHGGARSVLWVGGSEASLLRVEVPASLPAPGSFRAVIRRVTPANALPLALDPAAQPELPYAVRALNFAFATDRLGVTGARFEVRLDDDGTWSEPLAGATFPLTAMPPGRHVLAVRARDADGQLSTPAEFAFEVLPPWWRTARALAAYALGGAIAIASMLRWRFGATRRRNLRLEELIATRTQELQAAKIEADTANAAKSAFLANMSHELRTPLNAILGYAQILRKETGLSPKGQRQLEIVGRNGEHLLQMINEVLDLAKIEAGKMTLQAAEFPLTRVGKSAADLLEQRAADKGLAFRLELGAGLPRTVCTDEHKLRQILLNLLGNAVKFTTRGEVVLAISRLNGHVRFEVRDTGPGIAANQIAALFQPFHQVAPSPATPGTGLGLAISQRLARLLGGRIEVESEPGRGSRFWLDLVLPEVRGDLVHPPALRIISGYTGPRRRLLVADDEPTNRAVLRDLLEPVGFAIEEVADGEACIAAVNHHAPDAVLLDLRMPGLSGLDVAQRLRARPQAAAMPVIAVSASVLGFNHEDAVAAGCDAFLAKPVQEAQLLDTLGHLLELEWTYRESTTPFAAAAPSSADRGGLPAADEIAALSALARRGDLDGLRSRIAERLALGGPGGDFLRRLDALAAGFKTAEIRQELAEAHASQNPSSNSR